MISWVIAWTLFAVSTGVVWDFLVNASLRADRVLARGVIVFLALALLTIVVVLVDLLGAIAQHAWDNYPWAFARNIVAMVAGVFIAAATTYVWFMVRLLKWTWPHIVPWFKDVPWSTTNHLAGSSDWLTRAFLIVLNAALLWCAFCILRRDPFYSYRHALGVLGLRKCVVGVCLMAYLRLLVPRRDFFIHAPVVSVGCQ